MGWFDDNAPSPQVGRGRMADANVTGTIGATRSGAATIPGGQNTIDSQTGGQDYGSPYRNLIAQSLMAGYGYVDPAQLDYYERVKAQSAAEGDPRDDNYWAQRAMGWQAGGADVATQGPYAGQNSGSAPMGTVGGVSGGGMIPGGMPAGWSTTGANRLASFSAPGLAAPWTEEFRARDPNQIAQDPSYKFQLGQGLEAIQRSAASKGTLLTGGTLKALNEFGQGLASTFDDKFYNRDRGEYSMAQDTFNQNKNSAYGMLSGMAGSGQQAAGAYGSNVADLYSNNALANASLYGNQGDINATGTLTGAQNNATMWNNLGSLANAGATAYQDYLKRKKATPAPLAVSSDPNALSRLGTPVTLGVPPNA